MKFREPRCDLAVIELERMPPGVQALRLAASSVVPGQRIHSIGNPGVSGALWVYTPGSEAGQPVNRIERPHPEWTVRRAADAYRYRRRDRATALELAACESFSSKERERILSGR